ncbi:MAG: glycosyltransferase [Shimia sp.]
MPGPRRLLAVSHSAGLSGAERSLAETLTLLAPRHEVHVLLPGPGPLEARLREVPGLAGLHRIRSYFDYARPGTAAWRRGLHRGANALARRRARALARRLGIQAVYANSVASWLGARVAGDLGLPLVWHLRESIEDGSIGRPHAGAAAQARLLARPGTAYLANARFVAEWYAARFGIAPEVAYQPVAAPVPRTVPAGPGLRLVAVGHLGAQKRHTVAIDAVAALPTRLGARLDIYGEGPDRAALETRIAGHGASDRIVLHGYSTAVSEALACADALLAPSVGEGFGRVTAEALLTGCPVIGAASGGTAELLAEGRGTLVAPDDAPALAAAIAAFAADPGPARAAAEAGRAWATATLTPEAYLARIEAALAAACADADG